MTDITRQFDLLKGYGELGVPFVHRSETSQAAAEALPAVGTKRRRVYEFISEKGLYGATDEEIQIGLRMPGDTERPRRRELEKAKLIHKSGQNRPTRANRLADVYVVKWPTQEELL